MEIHGSLGFRSANAETADSPTARWRGLMGRRAVPLLVRASSVHGFWLRSPLWLVGIATDGTVVAVRRLRRRRVVWIRGAHWVLELPPHHPLPRRGERLAFSPRRGEAGGDARTPLPVRHTDRKPV